MDSTRIVDQDVDAAEVSHGLLDGGLHTCGIADVTLDRQGLTTCSFDLFSSSVDRTLKSLLLNNCLSCDGNVSAILGTSLSDLESNTTRGTRDENCLSLKRSSLTLHEVVGDEGSQGPERHTIRTKVIVHVRKSVVHLGCLCPKIDVVLINFYV